MQGKFKQIRIINTTKVQKPMSVLNQFKELLANKILRPISGNINILKKKISYFNIS